MLVPPLLQPLQLYSSASTTNQQIPVTQLIIMPSIYTITAAALALAGTAVAQSSGPDTNTTCPNPDE